MTKLTKIAAVLVALALALPALAQTQLTITTLSAAMSTSYGTQLAVTSATNINAPSTSDNTKHTFLYVDREAMDVRSVNGTTITVVRGAEGTRAEAHASGAYVFVIPAYLSTSFGKLPAGSCTRANEVALPRIQFSTGLISDCDGGVWVTGSVNSSQNALAPIANPNVGAVALTSLETAGTAAGASTEMYCTEIQLPYSRMLTGLKILNGTTVGTDKHNVELYDSGGKLLANSAAAGAVTSGASTYQAYAFTQPYFAVGPGRYFGCFTASGTTDTVRHLVTALDEGLLAGKITGLTFGTVPSSITAPSTFTTALGAYLQLY